MQAARGKLPSVHYGYASSPQEVKAGMHETGCMLPTRHASIDTTQLAAM